MRLFIHLALAGISFAAMAAGSAIPAEAQSRKPLYIEVKPRSWLDAGKVVPVGSMQNYMHDIQGSASSNRYGVRGGDFGLLPDRFSSGRRFMIDFR